MSNHNFIQMHPNWCAVNLENEKVHKFRIHDKGAFDSKYYLEIEYSDGKITEICFNTHADAVKIYERLIDELTPFSMETEIRNWMRRNKNAIESYEKTLEQLKKRLHSLEKTIKKGEKDEQ